MSNQVTFTPGVCLVLRFTSTSELHNRAL